MLFNLLYFRTIKLGHTMPQFNRPGTSTAPKARFYWSQVSSGSSPVVR